MAREKIKNIFNKNHISIIYYENTLNKKLTTKDNEYDCYVYSKEQQTTDCTLVPHLSWRYQYNNKPKNIVIRKKSPLGFYYNHKETIFNDNTNIKKYSESKTIKSWNFIFKDKRYEISYLTEYNDVRINTEVRPWDISDDKSIEEHYIYDLINDINNILEIANSNKLVNVTKFGDNYSYFDKYSICNNDLNAVKREIYTDLFGYPDGLKIQTNKEKIESHGFDYKTSFRNM